LKCEDFPFSAFFLDRTISSAVEQHLFDVNPLEAQQSDNCELTTCSSRVTPTARQRRRAQREQQQEEGQKHREKNRYCGHGIIMKEVINSSHAERTPKPRKPKNNPTFMQLTENKAAQAVSQHPLILMSFYLYEYDRIRDIFSPFFPYCVSAVPVDSCVSVSMCL
uniref:Uncharacterized protein n=1 Tax=Amphilophus citrinellus TaxID=61819 RepID=A0A3Q0SNJ7_AMPCI